MPCDPKLTFGDGDVLEGTKAMVAMIKARNRAQVFEQNSKGQDPSTLKLTVVRMTPEGRAQKEISHVDLLAQAAPLDAHAKSCEGCPANFLGTAFGCYGALPYPVTAAGEKWLVNRLQPADSLGGLLLLSALREFYDGAPIRGMRSAGMFELTHPAEKVLEQEVFGSTRVSGDQLFQAFFSVGKALGPGHCSMLLIFVGALEINGRIPTTKGDRELLTMARAKAPDERRKITKLALGPEGPDLHAIHDLLRGTYTAWVLNVELLMDA